jgi:thiazole/oxazole-forming peptide maturase SagD family component
MKLEVRGAADTTPAAVERLARRLVHPLCGLDRRVGFVLRGRAGPRFAVTGGELSGVHRLLGKAEPGAYHIGGVGLSRAEALVRALGESVERYCQLLSVAGGTVPVRVATVAAARAAGPLLDPGGLRLFTAEQYARPGFPFEPATPDARYGWVELAQLPDGAPVQVPAQLALVGYAPHRGHGEPWLTPAVTTGTATHRTTAAATRGALLELIQIDAAMGHWYGPAPAPRITPGDRLRPLHRLLDRYLGSTATAQFHALPWQPDPERPGRPGPSQPAHVVACLLRQPPGRLPVAVAGLGCDTRLADACYRALLEAVGVLQLARVALANAAVAGTGPAGATGNGATGNGATGDGTGGGLPAEDAIYDLDSNVAYYAEGGGADILAAKFPGGHPIGEDALPPDWSGPADAAAARLAEHLLAAGHRLYRRDLTTVDTASLGLVTERVWSPDLLALAMPSAPPLDHPRFAAYGGGTHSRPHPYP